MTGCETGCKKFTGGEVKHHPDCKYYPGSLSKMYDDLQSEVEKLRLQNTGQGSEINRVRHGLKISIPHLTGFGFIKDNNGSYWIDLQTHYLELIPSEGYWYPVYAVVPEMSHEDEQRVNTNRIQFVHELQNLFFALTGNELEMKVDRSHC